MAQTKARITNTTTAKIKTTKARTANAKNTNDNNRKDHCQHTKRTQTPEKPHKQQGLGDRKRSGIGTLAGGSTTVSQGTHRSAKVPNESSSTRSTNPLARTAKQYADLTQR